LSVGYNLWPPRYLSEVIKVQPDVQVVRIGVTHRLDNKHTRRGTVLSVTHSVTHRLDNKHTRRGTVLSVTNSVTQYDYRIVVKRIKFDVQYFTCL
jgi:hypothetical protein